MAEITKVIVTTFTPEATASNLLGYYLKDDMVTSMMCGEKQELIASDDHPFCCATKSHGDCYQGTTCVSNIMTDSDRDTWSCDEGWRCQGMTIYDQYEDSTDGSSGTRYWCYPSSIPSVVYRNFPYTGISTVTDTTTTTTDTESQSSTSQTAAIPIATETDSAASTGSSSHTGAIAGGVVGGVVGFALIIAAVFFLVKRRQKTKREELNEIGPQYVVHEQEK